MQERLWKSRSGNFGILSALLMLPLMLACGVAVDYANLSRLKSNLQNANDAAALMAARHLDQTGTLPSKDEVEKTLKANLRHVASIADLSIKNDNVVLTSTAHANLLFGGILPERTSEVGVLSAVEVQNDKQLDVVLVLDNTKSMSYYGKIDALKKAAANFVDTLLALNRNNRTNVRIGIVPFSNYVNVGMENRYAKWMDVPEDTSSTRQSCSSPRGELLSKTCHPATGYDDGVPYEYQACTYEYAPSDEPEVCEQVTDTRTWHGCVGSRGPYPNNVRDGYYISESNTYEPFPGVMNVSCPSPITPLTADETTLEAQVASMKATGQTYIAEGVMWGLRVLSDAVPFTESATDATGAVDPAKHQKIMVLMTDGDNTKSPQLPDAHNSGSDAAKADQLGAEACQQVKNAEVTLYTISFGEDVSESGKALMQTCADNGKFYDAAQVSEISKTFHAIAASIASIRLTQ